MNPVIVIPTYYTARRRKTGSGSGSGLLAIYDHATTVSQEGELGRCLESIQNAQGNVPVIILVAAEPSIEKIAAERVQKIASRYTGIQSLVIGSQEEALVRQRMEQLNLGNQHKGVGLTGYSAIRNMGLVVASVFGFDAVVFIDDDEVIEDPEFLKNAVYGLGKLTKKGIPIIAKSGYFLDAEDAFTAKGSGAWYDRFWEQKKEFDKWITRAMSGPRLSRSNHVCGGCLALHREAFRRVSFDPWITRGEDLDYLLNLRMYGSDMWFDNKWCLRHLPPEGASSGVRFGQDVYRWLYEVRKLEYSRTQIDLLQIKAESLYPYPGPFLEPSVYKRIRRTARLRSLFSSDRRNYARALKAAKNEAASYAARNCASYFEFQAVWPELIARLENDLVMRKALVQSTTARKSGLRPDNTVTPVVPAPAPAAAAAAPVEAPAEAPAPAAAAAPAPAAAAPARTPEISLPSLQPDEAEALVHVSYDPGRTSEIQLNLED